MVYALSTQDNSAALAPGNACRSAPNAANRTVLSMDTRNTAILAIQKVGQGDRCVWAWAAPCPAMEFVVVIDFSVPVRRRRAGYTRRVAPTGLALHAVQF